MNRGAWPAALVGGVALLATAGIGLSGGQPVADGGERTREQPPDPGPTSAWQAALLGELSGEPRAGDVAGHTAVLPPTHTVAPGETLGGVAERYRVTSRSLARTNAVDRQGTLRPGQELVIPGEDPLDLTTPEEVMDAGLAVQRLLSEAAAESGLDPALVQAVAWAESRWKQRVVSDRGAIGILQVRPRTAAAMAHLLGRELDVHTVEDNVLAGTAYLARRLDRHQGDLPAALADYHQGPHSVGQRGRIPATEHYIADVLRLQGRFAAYAQQ